MSSTCWSTAIGAMNIPYEGVRSHLQDLPFIGPDLFVGKFLEWTQLPSSASAHNLLPAGTVAASVPGTCCASLLSSFSIMSSPAIPRCPFSPPDYPSGAREVARPQCASPGPLGASAADPSGAAFNSPPGSRWTSLQMDALYCFPRLFHRVYTFPSVRLSFRPTLPSRSC